MEKKTAAHQPEQLHMQRAARSLFPSLYARGEELPGRWVRSVLLDAALNLSGRFCEDLTADKQDYADKSFKAFSLPGHTEFSQNNASVLQYHHHRPPTAEITFQITPPLPSVTRSDSKRGQKALPQRPHHLPLDG